MESIPLLFPDELPLVGCGTARKPLKEPAAGSQRQHTNQPGRKFQPCSIASYLNPLQIQAKRRFGELPGAAWEGLSTLPTGLISLRAGDKIREVWRQLLSPWLSVPVLLPPALLPKTPHATAPLAGELEPRGSSSHRPCASCSSCCWWRGLENAPRGFSSHGGRSRAPRGHLLALPAQPCKAKPPPVLQQLPCQGFW